MIFVDSITSRDFFSTRIKPYLANVIPIFLPTNTPGTLATVLSAVSLLPSLSENSSFLVDLADIEIDHFENTHLKQNPADRLTASAYFFNTFSADSRLSYFLLDRKERRYIIGAAEKSPVSTYASPGIYYFHSVPAFMKLVSCSLQNQNTQYKHYMTPLFDERKNKSGVTLIALRCSGITYY
jgi:hypothetical protein